MSWNRHVFHYFIVFIYFYQHLLLSKTSASSLLFTLDHVRYSLSDRVLTIPKLGSLRGLHIDYEHSSYKNYHLVNVEAFLGIQYGLYHARFEPSKERFELHPSSKVNKQIQFGPACAQRLWTNITELKRIRHKVFAEEYYPKLLRFIQHQDENQCLNMNIYQPQIKDLKESLPVLIFIHGDGYDMSTGAAFDGAVFASYTRTIVVTINYRLGPFGFLYQSRENKGDYALQDIYTGLHWLKNYVTNFNGDPDRITVYGTGSGAVLASLTVMLETVNGGAGSIKRRKSLVHRLILNDQTFLSPSMTSMINEVALHQQQILSKLSCSTLNCLRNQTIISTDDFLQLNSYAKKPTYQNYFNPLEHPFPFIHNFDIKNGSWNPLRMKFYHQSQTLLPDPLPILLTISSETHHRLIMHERNFDTNNDFIDYLINYAYTKWNSKTREYDFDRYLFNYHQQILAPLLKYAQHAAKNRAVHLLERHSNRFISELPFTFGYVLAPSLSVFNETYLNSTDDERVESMKTMDLFANLIHTGNINNPSPFAHKKFDHEWNPIFPDFYSILVKDGKLTENRADHAQVHYLFNSLISNLTDRSMDSNIIHAWKTLYEVSLKSNQTIHTTKPLIRSSFLSKGFFPVFNLNNQHEKYLWMVFFISLMLLLINVALCVALMKRGPRNCRKHHYNCLNTHNQLKGVHSSDVVQRHGGSSPSSTNSNGTITLDSTQHLIVSTNSHEQEHQSSPLSSLLCTTTTANSSINSSSPIDILHPINITKKNGILKCSSLKKTNSLIPSSLPEAVV